MRIPQRIKIISELISYPYLIDVGTDHCLLPYYVTKRHHICDHVFALEKNIGPYNIAKNIIQKHNLNHVKLLNTDKFITPLFKETSIVIAGLSGKTIYKYIYENIKNIRKCSELIVQPVQHIDFLRNRLSFIFKEQIVVEMIVANKNVILTKYGI